MQNLTWLVIQLMQAPKTDVIPAKAGIQVARLDSESGLPHT